MGVLYLVATPIGNLQDITPRALDTLRRSSLIAAEDTRTARQLLAHFDIHTPVTSYFEHSKPLQVHKVLDALETGDVAVISEAGMPGINDPGEELVRRALERGHRVVPIPGPSAILAALVASGLAGPFYFLGFLPREPRRRRNLLREVASDPDTLIAFEAPHRLIESLADIAEIMGNRQMCIAREVTKRFEEFSRGTVQELRAQFENRELRGEFTLVIAGASKLDRDRTLLQEGEWNDARVVHEATSLLQSGIPRTEVVKRIATKSGRARREIYRMLLGVSGGKSPNGANDE